MVQNKKTTQNNWERQLSHSASVLSNEWQCLNYLRSCDWLAEEIAGGPAESAETRAGAVEVVEILCEIIRALNINAWYLCGTQRTRQVNAISVEIYS